MNTFVVLVGVFFMVVLALVLLRSWLGASFEVKNSDVLLALVPVVFWLLLSGEVKVLEFAGFKMELAFEQASSRTIEGQVDQLPVERIAVEAKASYGRIPRLIEQRVQGLGFELDRGGYYNGGVIRAYLDRLTEYPFFRYIVIHHPDGRFFGMADARTIHGHLKSGGARDPRGTLSGDQNNVPGESPSIRQEPLEQTVAGSDERPARVTYRQFADWLNRGDTPSLLTLPGMVSSAVVVSTPRQQALETMEKKGFSVLPVVDENQQLVGVVERGRLVASLILDVSERIN